MDNVYLRDLLPNDLEFDINIHILKFMPDVCHPLGLARSHKQASYTTGREPHWYIYSKDMNRDADFSFDRNF